MSLLSYILCLASLYAPFASPLASLNAPLTLPCRATTTAMSVQTLDKTLGSPTTSALYWTALQTDARPKLGRVPP